MRRHPIFAVHGLPFAFETFGVTASHPEFRLLEVDRFGASIQRSLHANAEELSKIGSRTHVINIASVANLISITVRLRFVLVVDSVEPAIEIILIVAPGDTGHHVDAIAPVPPGANQFGQTGVDAINDGNIRAEVSVGAPSLAGLEAGTFERLFWVGRKRRRKLF